MSEMGDVLQARDEYRLQQWSQMIQQCRESGLSNREYCRQNGISEKTFYYWLRKLRSIVTAGDVPRLVELRDQAPAEDMIHIRFRNAEMTLPADTDVDAITAVLRSLQKL